MNLNTIFIRVVAVWKGLMSKIDQNANIKSCDLFRREKKQYDAICKSYATNVIVFVFIEHVTFFVSFSFFELQRNSCWNVAAFVVEWSS